MIAWGIFISASHVTITVVDLASNIILRTVHGADKILLLTSEVVELAIAAGGGNKPVHIGWIGTPYKDTIKRILKFARPSILPSKILKNFGICCKISYCPQDRGAAAGAFYTSRLASSAVLAMSVYKEKAISTAWAAAGKKLNKKFSSSSYSSIDEIHANICSMLGKKPGNVKEISRSANRSEAANLVNYIICTYFVDEYSVRIKKQHLDKILQHDMYLNSLQRSHRGQQIIAAALLILIDNASDDLVRSANDIVGGDNLCVVGPEFMFQHTDKYNFNNIVRSRHDFCTTVAIGAIADKIREQLQSPDKVALRRVK